MIAALTKPFHLGSLEVVIGASIAIAFAAPWPQSGGQLR